jgi:hypothetical protein
MKHQRMLTFLALVALMAGLTVTAAAQQGEETVDDIKLPRLQVSQTEFNFGRVAQGASISHVFWMKNVGGDSLHIEDVKPG